MLQWNGEKNCVLFFIIPFLTIFFCILFLFFFFGRDLFLEGRLMAGQINEKVERREKNKGLLFSFLLFLKCLSSYFIRQNKSCGSPF